MTEVIAFDVNETLLDLAALDGPFERIFGDTSLRGQWFSAMLQLSFVGGLTGDYVDFSTAQRAAAVMLAERRGTELSPASADELVGAMRSLPPHPEVVGALRRLANTPLRVVALTNSPLDVAEVQLAYAGLREHFDAVYSADAVRALKPAKEPYLAVARQCQVAVSEVRLVAAHSWDITGALAAGCRAAFVARPGAVLSPLGARPDIVGRDIDDVVDQITRTDIR
jgi:2-haloacid dehalogenase